MFSWSFVRKELDSASAFRARAGMPRRIELLNAIVIYATPQGLTRSRSSALPAHMPAHTCKFWAALLTEERMSLSSEDTALSIKLS